MGVGYTLIVPLADAEKALEAVARGAVVGWIEARHEGEPAGHRPPRPRLTAAGRDAIARGRQPARESRRRALRARSRSTTRSKRRDMAGTRVERHMRPPGDVAGVDRLEFGGSWSSEVARRRRLGRRATRRGIVGFAAFDPRGLRFSWLRAWSARRDVGIFGPFGVAERARGSGLGVLLLRAALFARCASGATRPALIPAVGRRPAVAPYYEREPGAQVVESVDLGATRRRAARASFGLGQRHELRRPWSTVPAAGRCRWRSWASCATGRARRSSNGPRAPAFRCDVAAWDRVPTSASALRCRVIDAVAAAEPELVLLLGWMHVLPAAFVERFADDAQRAPVVLAARPGRGRRRDDAGRQRRAGSSRRARARRRARRRRAAGAGAPCIGSPSKWTAERSSRVLRSLRGAGEDKDAFVRRLHALEHRVLASAVKRWAYETPRGG